MKELRMLKVVCLLVVVLSLFSGTPVFAQSKTNVGLPWDALIEFSGGSVAAGIGFSWGSGTLTQAGKTYSLKIDGLSVGSVGITKASAYGKVYRLKKLSDINGNRCRHWYRGNGRWGRHGNRHEKREGGSASIHLYDNRGCEPLWARPASKSNSNNRDSSLIFIR